MPAGAYEQGQSPAAAPWSKAPMEQGEGAGPDGWLAEAAKSAPGGLNPSAQGAASLMSHWAEGPRPTLRLGSRGEDVVALQKALLAQGAKLTPDGQFGSITHAAVIAFQQVHGLSPDGVVGAMTWAALDNGKGGSSPGATNKGPAQAEPASTEGGGKAAPSDATDKAPGDSETADGEKTAGEKLREEFLERATPGKSIMSQSDIDAQNSKTKQGKFSTCIEFARQMVNNTKGADGKMLKFQGPNAYKEVNPQAKLSANKDLPPGSFQTASPGMSERPKPGDLLILAFAKATPYGEGEKKVILPRGAFSHICILRSIEPAEDPAQGETWTTIDGGGTSSAQIKRPYQPDQSLLSGSLLKGWFDIEKMAGY